MSDFARFRTAMVDSQVRPNDVTSYPVIEALLHVAREDFLPDSLRGAAYAGVNLDLAPGRVVLEPRTLAKLMEELAITPADFVLDLGCGLGYSAAVIGRIAEAVVAVEELDGMAEAAQARLSAAGMDNVAVEPGPLAAGAAKHAPYDVILLEGAIESFPAALADQLKEGGRIGAIFAEGALGVVRIGHKSEGRIYWRDAFNAGAPVLPGFARAEDFAL